MMLQPQPQPQPPAPGAERADRTRHVTGQEWPACGCRLCVDEFICPAAVTRVGRALALTAALGVIGAVVGAL